MGDQAARRRSRLDRLMVCRGLARSRSSARQLVRDGVVCVAGRVERRPGRRISVNAQLEVRDCAAEYVSRGGRKLAAAFAHFGLSVDGASALDVGASTGGFTEYLLRAGAQRVVAVDVGREQLAPSLRSDHRVHVLDRTDARDLPPLVPSPGVIVVDVSFVRLRDVLPAVLRAAPQARWALVLLKPQFELPGRRVPRDGVIKDARERNRTLLDFLAWAARRGICVVGSAASALSGSSGNQETFVLLQAPCPNQPGIGSDYDGCDGTDVGG